MKPRRYALNTAGSRGMAVLSAAVLLTLSACGGGGGHGASSPPTGPAEVSGTLAYVETLCRATKDGLLVEHQELRIRQGEGEPVTVFETPEVSAPDKGPVCPHFVGGRFGDYSISFEALQWLNVSPDGTSVVFEVTDEFSSNPKLPLKLPSKGIFWVGADGKGLRPLGPPSRERFFYVVGYGGVFRLGVGMAFSPSGRTIAFVDKVPDADGHEADQVVTIDVASGTRTQVTHLPPAVPPSGYPPDAPTIQIRETTSFVDEQTISFYTSANPDGKNPDCAPLPDGSLNPNCTYLLMTIKTDGSGLDAPLPIPVAAGGAVEQQFIITGDKPRAFIVGFKGKPANEPVLTGFPMDLIREIFVIDEEKNILQLTNFRRQDTFGPLIDVDEDHVYFAASANPLELGTNPSENCQIFSIDRTGADLRQLTHFYETEHSSAGCSFGPLGQGCGLFFPYQDPRTRTLFFYSDCDPLGTKRNGAQIFAMRPDGSGLRQLTDAQGLVREAPGVISGDIPGQLAYGPYAF